MSNARWARRLALLEARAALARDVLAGKYDAAIRAAPGPAFEHSPGLPTVMRVLQAKVLAVESEHPRYASAHEAYGVLCEEVREFASEVYAKDRLRSPLRMTLEAYDIAVVAVRIALTFGESSS